MFVKQSGLVASTWVGLLGRTQLPESFTAKVEHLRQLLQEAEDDIAKSESSTGSSDYDDDDIEQINADLEADTRSLMELDALFSEPILDTGNMRQSLPSSSHKWEPHEPYKHIITNRFPKADDGLITSLGKANYERFLRGQEQRHSSSRALLDPSMLQEIENLDAASSKFNDSGLGSSIPSSYAETIMSYHGGEGTSIRLPSLPKLARNGSSFLCIACGLPTVVQTNSAWKRHLFNDLRPWQCLESSCGHKGVFSTRGDWVSHLTLDHFGPEWKGAECPLCRDDTGNGKITILKHIGGHLEEISLACLPSDPDSETESQISDTSQQDGTAGSVGEKVIPSIEDSDRLKVQQAVDLAKKYFRENPEIYKEFKGRMQALRSIHISSMKIYDLAIKLVFDDTKLAEGHKFSFFVKSKAVDEIAFGIKQELGSSQHADQSIAAQSTYVESAQRQEAETEDVGRLQLREEREQSGLGDGSSDVSSIVDVHARMKEIATEVENELRKARSLERLEDCLEDYRTSNESSHVHLRQLDQQQRGKFKLLQNIRNSLIMEAGTDGGDNMMCQLTQQVEADGNDKSVHRLIQKAKNIGGIRMMDQLLQAAKADDRESAWASWSQYARDGAVVHQITVDLAKDTIYLMELQKKGYSNPEAETRMFALQSRVSTAVLYIFT
ncbi:hypothetical protein CSIM01_11769 [Colletotrichum simmondsii]|uniref:Oxidoreductase acuF-like C2H2 type zinc-finger domain-containing protein n=1 Tax=Colletotrichum simmondsii TaxID=703756 RepID=A0A135SCG9_9PEZI|nr:hypothetical protein CSIM01_11769 [Colletotrichum simmondsii]